MVKIIAVVIIGIFCCFNVVAQDSSLPATSTVNKYTSKRVTLVTGASIVAYGTSLLALNQTWYKNFPKTSFHTFNDAGEWQQIDKVGHAWSVYNLSRLNAAAWRWAGMPEQKSVLAGTITALSYLTVIEILDAHSEKWGWSWADMGANIAGASLFAAQQLGWKEQRIQVKFSTHRKNYTPELNQRANELFGNSLPERILKDYNGQTHWLSFNINSFLRRKKIPNWLNISFGYGAEGMFGGYRNVAYDKNGNISFSRPDIKRYRQWYLSPDIDLTKINSKSKLIRTVLAGLNAIKIPAPSLEISNGKVKGNWVSF